VQIKLKWENVCQRNKNNINKTLLQTKNTITWFMKLYGENLSFFQGLKKNQIKNYSTTEKTSPLLFQELITNLHDGIKPSPYLDEDPSQK
jgi:hypothetical protein